MRFKAERCVVHFGLAKTGTTSIQEAAFRKRDQLLREHGALYPGNVPNHWHFQSLFAADPSNLIQVRRLNLSPSDTADYLRRYKAGFEDQVDRHKPRMIVLSSEYLVSMKDDELAALRRYLDQFCQTLDWIAYVRDPWSFAFSHQHQLLRDGLARGKVKIGYAHANVEILDRLVKHFGKPFAVRPYVATPAGTPDVVRDFFGSVGLGFDPGPETNRARNASIGRAAACFLSFFNEAYPALDERGAYRIDEGRDWCVDYLLEAAQAVRLSSTISRSTADLIYDQAKADIDRLESEYFGDNVFTRHHASQSYDEADDAISLELLSRTDVASVLIEAMRRLSQQAAWDRKRAEQAEASLRALRRQAQDKAR